MTIGANMGSESRHSDHKSKESPFGLPLLLFLALPMKNSFFGMLIPQA